MDCFYNEELKCDRCGSIVSDVLIEGNHEGYWCGKCQDYVETIEVKNS